MRVFACLYVTKNEHFLELSVFLFVCYAYPFYGQVMMMMRMKLVMVMVPEIDEGFLLQFSPAKIKPAAWHWHWPLGQVDHAAPPPPPPLPAIRIVENPESDWKLSILSGGDGENKEASH